MRYLDVCAGISAPTMAWHPLGWKALCYAEIDAAPRAVLAHHYPDVPLVGDFTQIKGDEYGPVDLLVGGTPCQDFSVAGLRAGLDGERGNLSLEYLRLADRARPRWLVWENVPGVLSIDGGRAFGAILGGMAQLGYGFAYRVLDAQHFGVPQRRRRVFVVGYLGDWRRAAAVLFERHSLQGNSPPRREKGEGFAADAAPSLTASGRGVERTGESRGQDPVVAVRHIATHDIAGTMMSYAKSGGDSNRIDNAAGGYMAIVASTGDISHCLNAGGMGRQDYETETLIAHALRGEGFDASEDGTNRDTPLVPVSFTGGASECLSLENCAHPVTGRNGDPGMVAMAFDLRGREGGAQFEGPHDSANLRAASGGSSRSYVASSAVRRLTPRECERLQGFPDDFTLVPYRKGMMADGPRYKMLGNSMAVPVVRWIGERIAMVEAMCAVAVDRAA